MSKVIHLKVKNLQIRDGEELIVVMNEKEAWNNGFTVYDKVELKIGWENIVANLDFSTNLVKYGELGIFQDVFERYDLKNNELISLRFTERASLSLQAIRKKMQWKKINEEEIYAIIKDISENKLTDTLMTYYVASSFFQKTTNDEMYVTAKAMADTGVTFTYPKGDIVADKHCIGWVPGNETTMILIPLLASLGIKMPKNFSKAITSPAATGECVSVLMNTEFDKKGIQSLIKKNNACLVWGWGLDLAPADDKIIQVSYPLSMQNIAKVVSSIMAKKYAMWITHSLIDIPVWPTAKVKNQKEAKEWKSKFEYVAKRMWMKMHVAITKAEQPIGAWIGAVLQVREVLRVLQRHELRPLDLENKAIELASDILKLVGIAHGSKAKKILKEQLDSGKAREMMQKIIKVQAYPKGRKNCCVKWNPWNVKSEELILPKYSLSLKASSKEIISSIDMHHLNMICRTLGAPYDLQAGIYLEKKMWDSVSKWDVLCIFYSSDESKLDIAKKMFTKKSFYSYK